MNAADVRTVAHEWLEQHQSLDVEFGLPEFDDRFRVWRVALLARHNGRDPIGEVQVRDGLVVRNTNISLIAKRAGIVPSRTRRANRSPAISFRPVQSSVVLGDARSVLSESPPGLAQLVFTSPPYYNAKPEFHEATTYDEYLDFLGDVFSLCHAVLSEGRFLVVNTSPVLVRRANRQSSSQRVPIPFDLHHILDGLGFEFIDDIVWQKPEAAGWHLGRGRRFAADRQPLQYKPVTVTEYVMVYRKRTDRLIDWNIRNHPNPSDVLHSLIDDGYERTNVWEIQPSQSKDHSAVFPYALAERVVRYYSFAGDLVLDPFAGTGTTGKAAADLGRRFMLIDNAPQCFDMMRSDPTLVADMPHWDDLSYIGSTL